MVTTRSGRSTAAARNPLPSQPRGIQAPTSAPITKIPNEILFLIAWSLPMGLGQSPQHLQPSTLYPLARTCKGFWACLSPLLYELDIECERHRVGYMYSPLQEAPLSALVWGLKNNQPTTAHLAISTAQSMGQLQAYAHASYMCQTEVAWPPLRDSGEAASVNMELDALFLAVLQGNANMVEALTEGATAHSLSRNLGSGGRYPLGSAFPWYHPDHKLTGLHLAILGQHHDVVKVLLRRYAELDQSTLKWFEPTGLHFAAFIGDVRMAQLILDGDSSDSPWVPRARSQLLDPRAYFVEFEWDATLRPGHLDSPHPPPPFIFAAQGTTSNRPQWFPDEDEIFAFLASKDPSLPTKSCPRTTMRESPVAFALERMDTSPPTSKRLLALIRTGALDIHHPELACQFTAWNFFPHWTQLTENPCAFIGECWDAALEHHGGTADAEFLAFWEHGLSQGLPAPWIPKWGDKSPMDPERAALQQYLEVISLFESKAQGFAQLPAIRPWLDEVFGQRASRQTMTVADVDGDWTHLV